MILIKKPIKSRLNRFFLCYNPLMNSVKNLTWLNSFICLLAIVAEIVFANKLNPPEKSVFIFLIVWGSFPILLLFLFLLKTPRLAYFLNWTLFQIIVVVGLGLIYKINTIYINPDPRGALAQAVVPVIQIIVALFIGLVIRIISQKYYRSLSEQNDQSEEEGNGANS